MDTPPNHSPNPPLHGAGIASGRRVTGCFVQVERISCGCRHGMEGRQMAYPRKAGRNDLVVEARDVKGMTFTEIARVFNLGGRQQAWSLYQREKRRARRLAEEAAA